MHRSDVRRWAALAVLPALLVLMAPSCELKNVTFTRTLIDASNTGADVKGVADIDGDGDNDVVAGDDSGLPLVWYENPSWTRRVIDSRSVFTTDLELGDVDRDGDPVCQGGVRHLRESIIPTGRVWNLNTDDHDLCIVA